MAGFQLRPLDTAGLLRASVVVYWRRLGTLIPIAGVLELPYTVLYVMLAEQPPELSPIPTDGELRDLLSVMGPWLAVRLFITSIMFAAVIRTVVEGYAGVESSWRQSTAAAISRMVAIAALTVIFWSATILGSALFVLPGIFVIVVASASLPALIVEGVNPLAAMTRSWVITRGRRLQVFAALVGTSLAVIVAGALCYLVMGVVLGWLQGDVGWRLASELSWVVTQPFIAVVLALLYLDQRIRKENLDSEWLSLQLSATSFDQ